MSLLKSSLTFWKSFDLDTQRPGLDQIGLEIAEFQRKCADARKQLGNDTKQFSKAPTGKEKFALVGYSHLCTLTQITYYRLVRFLSFIKGR
jgi:hypothetical protein